MKALVRGFLKDESGQGGLLAHVLLISGISLMIVPAAQDIGARLAEVFRQLTDALH